MLRFLLRFSILAAVQAVPAAAQVVCDPVLDTATCPPGSVNLYCPVVRASQCTTGGGQISLLHTLPPPPQYTELDCQFDFVHKSYSCSAWPKRGELSYYWRALGQVWLTSPNGSDRADMRCFPHSGNRVEVTVTSPYGLSTTTSLRINCSFLIED